MLEQAIAANTAAAVELNSSIRELLAVLAKGETVAAADAPAEKPKATKAKKADTPAETKAEEPQGKGVPLTYDTVAALIRTKVISDRDGVVAALKKFECKTLKDAKPEQYAAIYDAVAAL